MKDYRDWPGDISPRDFVVISNGITRFPYLDNPTVYTLSSGWWTSFFKYGHKRFQLKNAVVYTWYTVKLWVKMHIRMPFIWLTNCYVHWEQRVKGSEQWYTLQGQYSPWKCSFNKFVDKIKNDPYNGEVVNEFRNFERGSII
jgi:hypothetical protein